MRILDSELRHFLEMMAQMERGRDWAYSSPYEFLLKHGRVFDPADLPADGMQVVQSAVGRRRLRVKECFSNAADVVLADASGRLAYCEGFAARIIPVHHAWAVLDGQYVVDLTWNRAGEKMASSSLKSKIVGRFDDCAYLGVVFSRQRLGQALAECGHYDSLLLDFRRDYPLLREEFDAAKEVL